MSFTRKEYLEVYRFARSVEYMADPKMGKKLRIEAKRIAILVQGVIGQMPDVPEGGLIGHNKKKPKKTVEDTNALPHSNFSNLP